MKSFIYVCLFVATFFVIGFSEPANELTAAEIQKDVAEEETKIEKDLKVLSKEKVDYSPVLQPAQTMINSLRGQLENAENATIAEKLLNYCEKMLKFGAEYLNISTENLDYDDTNYEKAEKDYKDAVKKLIQTKNTTVVGNLQLAGVLLEGVAKYLRITFGPDAKVADGIVDNFYYIQEIIEKQDMEDAEIIKQLDAEKKKQEEADKIIKEEKEDA